MTAVVLDAGAMIALDPTLTLVTVWAEPGASSVGNPGLVAADVTHAEPG